jgi:HlyD family secretion protein
MGTQTTEAPVRVSRVPESAIRGIPERKPPLPRALSVVLLLVVVGACIGVVRLLRRPSDHRNGARVATVVRSDFVTTLRVNGTVEAVQSFTIAAPRLSGPGMGTLIVTKLVKSGASVRKGDLLVALDPQAQEKNALDRQAEYNDLVQQIAKAKADDAAALATDCTSLAAAEHAIESALLDMRKNEILSQIDAEKNQQTLEEARARHKQLKETFDLKRRAAQAQIRVLEIQRDRAFNAMRYARKNTERLSIRSPIDGVVVLNSIWKGGQMGETQEGDEVRPGNPILQVVNSAAMQIRSRVNQADINQLREGQPVRIALDAYPGLVLSGRLENIASVGKTSSLNEKVRSYIVLFSIHGADPRLMPDLSAGVDVELQRLPNVLVVPRDALVQDGQEYIVQADSGSGYSRRSVKIQQLGDVDAVVASGIAEGTHLLRNPGGTGGQP